LNRVYSLAILFISAVLLLIFHSQDLKQFWNTEIDSTGQYYQATFFRQAQRNTPLDLSQLGGRQIKNSSHEVIYQFVKPRQAELYLRPSLAKQTSLMDHDKKLFSYKNLKTLKLRLPHQNHETQLFHVSKQTPHRIHLNPQLKQASVFQLVLDNSGDYDHSERVINALEIFVVNTPIDDAIPLLPLFLAFLVAPVIWCWSLNHGLGFSIASSMGLTNLTLLLAHILWLLLPELIFILISASLLTCLVLLLLRTLLEKQTLPVSPFFWGILWLAAWLRWEEILIRASIPLQARPLTQQYYNHALSMELFSDHGFLAANLTHGPLYPFLIKLTGFVFGFSSLHMFYLSLLGGLLLLSLSYWLACQLLGKSEPALLIMLWLAGNQLLIRESGLHTPDIFSACLSLVYLLLMFTPLRNTWLRGLGRGLVLLLLSWNHLSFFPLACILVILDLIYQVYRSQSTATWKKSLQAGMISIIIITSGFIPCIYQNWTKYTTLFPESTNYVSRIANIEFSDRQGFPSSLDVIRRGDKAPGYQRMGLREYFLDYHTLPELVGAGLLGFLLLTLDSVGAVINVSSGENILSVLVHSLTGPDNLLPIISLFLGEIFAALLLVVFAWQRFVRYRVLLLLLALFMLPHSFFYGILMLKGHSLLQSLLDHQMLLVCTPILSLMLIDALVWLHSHRKRWLI